MIASIFLPLGLGYFSVVPLPFDQRHDRPSAGRRTRLVAEPTRLCYGGLFSHVWASSSFPWACCSTALAPPWCRAACSVVAAIGAVLFSMGETAGLLAFGRGMIGMGVAGALMSSFTAFALWLPTRHLTVSQRLPHGIWRARGACCHEAGRMGLRL